MPIQNDIFKMVSLRKPIEGLTIDPSEDITNSQVVTALDGMRVDPANTSTEVIRKLGGLPTLTENEVEAFTLNAVRSLLETQKLTQFLQISTLKVNISGSELSLDEFAASDDFTSQYQRLTDTWLILKLKKESTAFIEKIEPLIRIAHIVHRFHKQPNSLKEIGIIDRLRKARIVFPRNWRPSIYKAQELTQKYVEKLKKAPPPKSSKLSDEIKKKKEEFVYFQNEIKTLESIRSKSHRVYWQWKKTSDTLSTLDNAYFELLENKLTEVERAAFKKKTGGVDKGDLKTLDDLSFYMDTADAITVANDACAQIRVWEEVEKKNLSTAAPRVSSEDRPSIRAIGWGDLIVARERLVGYQANEIAHIENVMAGEEKVREHERTTTREEFTETETIEKTETEKDLQTTDRHELQTETSKTIQDNFSLDAGVNTSGSYGLTEVKTSLQVGFGHDSNESRNTSTETAKEIISKSVERVFESVRKLRRLTLTEKIRELNSHSIKNTRIEGSPEVPTSFSGIYLWVEKIHEIELRQYGKRLMVEFHIPEPGISLLDFEKSPELDIPKPAPLTVGPKDISEANYLCLTKLYSAQEVEPPPAQFINVGYTWSSTPDENADSGWAQDSVGALLSIPSKYIPISGKAYITAPVRPTAELEEVHLYLAVGGQEMINAVKVWNQPRDFDLEPVHTWPQGVPISILAKGHFDKTLVVHIAILCERTKEALTQWQIKTWEKIREAHQILVQDYERAVLDMRFRQNEIFQIQTRPAVTNRRIERNELKKWAIKTARLSSFNFNAIEQLGDFQEVDPLEADIQAPIVNFFEEAFEWDQMSYFLYPYFWGRRDTWKMRQQDYDKADPAFNAFLQAGASKVIVPVTPGYEDRILYYLESDEADELSKVNKLSPSVSPDSEYEDLWLELLTDKNDDLARGRGTMTVNSGETLVIINADGNPSWELTQRDIGRELFISGYQYFIESLVDGNNHQFHLNEPYKQASSVKAKYATGSVPFSPPWLVNIPTSLVILSEEKDRLMMQ